MRKIISIICITIMLLSMPIYGGSDYRTSEPIDIEFFDVSTESYSTSQVTSVNLIFGKDDIISDVPAFIVDGRTLVPIRFITDTLGAGITWNQATRQVGISKDGTEVLLTIDSAKAIVDGKTVDLPSGVPAKLVKYDGVTRTMVPFRFVSEQLGMDIKWLPSTYTAAIDYPKASIDTIEYKLVNGTPTIAIKGDDSFSYVPMYLKAFSLASSDKLIIDIPNTDLGSRDVFSQNIYENGIVSMRASLFETDPRDIVRVTIELMGNSTYKTSYNKATNELYVSFINEVGAINVQNDGDAIVIETEEQPVFNVEDLGDRVVIDVLDAELGNLNGQTIPINNEVIEQVRYSQFDTGYEGYDKVVRVVFDLYDGKSLADNMYVDAVNNNIAVYATTEPMNQLHYTYDSLQASTFLLELDQADKSSIYTDDVNDIITVKVDKNRIDLLDEVQMDMNDGIIKYINIDGKSNSSQYIIKIKYNSKTAPKIISGNSTSDEVKISFAGEGLDVINPLYASKLIVVDAGHGGKDPGASVQGVREKDLNLDTAIKLKNLLEELGFKVYLTREDDTYIGLYERAHIANALNADLFLSIHHNATSNVTSNGVLTVYDGKSTVPNNKAFVDIIQENMVETLQKKNKGLLNYPGIVVTRETQMPSALAELGFLTNDYERELLVQEWYRQKCAESLLNGIKEYVDYFK